MIIQSEKLTELNASELKKINGGSIMSDIGYAIGYAAGIFAKPFIGRYEKGYNEACGCN